MRYTRIFASFILASTLIFAFSVSTFAAAENESLYIYGLNCLYHSPNGSPTYREVTYYDEPSSSGVYQFNIPASIMHDQIEYDAKSLNILGYPDSMKLWQQGYIYTFNYEIRINTSSVPETSAVTFTFGVATLGDGDYISLFQDLGDVVYSYEYNSNYTTYYVTSTVYVDEKFNAGTVGDLEAAFCSLEMSIYEQSTVNISVRLSNVKVQKAIGEDAYYQASLDAITNLPSTEYGYIYNSMPDSEGEIDVIQGQILDVLQVYEPGIQQLVQILGTDHARPCVYFPEVHIPFLDVHLWDNHIFYVDDYLNSMDTQIMSYINTFLVFVRLVFFITFSTFTIYKICRIEWWY